jgi:hypothetical protein
MRRRDFRHLTVTRQCPLSGVTTSGNPMYGHQTTQTSAQSDFASASVYRSSNTRAPPKGDSFCNRLEGSAGSAVFRFFCASAVNASRGDGTLNRLALLPSHSLRLHSGSARR